MGEETELYLTVETEDAGSASRQAQMLERILLEECPTAKIHRIRTDLDKMDGGATLALALASPVLVEVVKALRSFLIQRRSAKIVVRKGTHSFHLEGASDQQVNALLAFLREEK